MALIVAAVLGPPDRDGLATGPDDAGAVSPARREKMAKELGDVLWYVAQLATELELELEQIARQNLEKLLSRQRRGVLSGSGDER